jgi:hypothetical protein
MPARHRTSHPPGAPNPATHEEKTTDASRTRGTGYITGTDRRPDLDPRADVAGCLDVDGRPDAGRRGRNAGVRHTGRLAALRLAVGRGFRDRGFRDRGFRDHGFRDHGFRDHGFRDHGGNTERPDTGRTDTALVDTHLVGAGLAARPKNTSTRPIRRSRAASASGLRHRPGSQRPARRAGQPPARRTGQRTARRGPPAVVHYDAASAYAPGAARAAPGGGRHPGA